jgi:D-glycero-D-manno-heptose 1,7-bisphosphate phosphatase
MKQGEPRAHPEVVDEGEAGPSSSPRKAVFIDKDGTLVHDVPYNADPALNRFTLHAMNALRLLHERGFALVVVTNQAGLATGRFGLDAFIRLRDDIVQRVLAEAGVLLTGFYFCPHAAGPQGQPTCLCRKPEPGLLLRAAEEHGLDLSRSWMVGDILNDVEAGRRAGCRTVLLDVGNETEWKMAPLRCPHARCVHLLDAARYIADVDAARHERPRRRVTLAEAG